MNKPDDAAVTASRTLFRHLHDQRSRTLRAARIYGVFRGDVLVNWGVGRNAKQWATRAAQNCWNNELRAQYIGTR